jgi:hypothetical protein
MPTYDDWLTSRITDFKRCPPMMISLPQESLIIKVFVIGQFTSSRRDYLSSAPSKKKNI